MRLPFRARLSFGLFLALSLTFSVASLILSALSLSTNKQVKKDSVRPPPKPLQSGNSTSSCESNSTAWQPTLAGFNAAGTSTKASRWWNSTDVDLNRFDVAYGNLSTKRSFHCGIGLESQCSAPTCADVGGITDAAWIFQVGNSIVNLDSMLNLVYNAITLSQVDATELTSNLADSVFKFKDPVWKPASIITWIAFAVSIIFTGGAFFGLIASEIAQAAGLVAGSLSQYLIQKYAPQPGLSRNAGIDRLDALFYSISTSARSSVENYTNQTFAGAPDSNGQTIIDYISSGSFASVNIIPSQTDAEQFFKAFLFAKAVGGYWEQKNIYAISTTANFSIGNTDWPLNHSWTSPNTSRTYVPYTFRDGKAKKPDGLEALNGTLFGINGTSVAESLGRAWEVAGNKYTDDTANKRIQLSFARPDLYTPFKDGASWEGVFNISVCDVGDRQDWVVNYGGKKLPCCCGNRCKDTREFIQKANLSDSQSWCDKCKKQLRGDHGLPGSPTDIDFGIEGCNPLSLSSSSGESKAVSIRNERSQVGVICGLTWTVLVLAFFIF